MAPQLTLSSWEVFNGASTELGAFVIRRKPRAILLMTLTDKDSNVGVAGFKSHGPWYKYLRRRCDWGIHTGVAERGPGM